jgi:hypothetical protein
MFLVAGGCNDTVDNGMFEAVDNGAPVAPAAQAPEEEVEVPLKLFSWSEDTLGIRRVETYGATGLWVAYEVWLYVFPDPNGNGKYEERCLTKGGRLWAHTYHDLGAYVSPGRMVSIRVSSWGDDSREYTQLYRYDPNGPILTFDVTSHFFMGWIYISNVQYKD